MQKISVRFLSVMFVVCITASLAYGEGYTYKANKEHLGDNVTPVEAFQMIKKDPEHTSLVDCRTRAEYLRRSARRRLQYSHPLPFYEGW